MSVGEVRHFFSRSSRFCRAGAATAPKARTDGPGAVQTIRRSRIRWPIQSVCDMITPTTRGRAILAGARVSHRSFNHGLHDSTNTKAQALDQGCCVRHVCGRNIVPFNRAFLKLMRRARSKPVMFRSRSVGYMLSGKLRPLCGRDRHRENQIRNEVAN